jgi:hypothetical protein
MTRKWRLLTAFLAVTSFMFAQLAVAAYSCPMSAVQAAPAPMAAMPCDVDPVDNANLCDNHCKYGSASVDSAKGPAASPQAVDSGLRVPALPAFACGNRAPIVRAAPPGTSPPLARFTVLRI